VIAKKLSLHRETVTTLQQDCRLEEVLGARWSWPVYNSCPECM
jgi:hypothetical protein